MSQYKPAHKINLRTLLYIMVMVLSFMSPFPTKANVPGGGTGTGGNVTVTDNGGTVVLANGIVSFTINKSNGNLTNFTYNGTNLLAGGHGGGSYYFDGSGGPGLTNSVYTLTVNPANNGGNQAEVWLQSTASPMDMAVYYDLLRGQQGVYNTMILTHQAGYADYPGAELRSNMYIGSIFDWLCVDPYRFRQMASPNDTSVAVAGAPAEVVQWTSGIYNGSTECKYAYSDPLGQLDTWGWASSSSSYGIWQVLPSHEYYDGGPMHRELTEHIGNTLLNMFGGGHYGFGSSGDQPAGSFSSKTFGPAFIYASRYTGSAGDPVSLKAQVLWADAKAQAAAEQGAWPYTWFNPQPVTGLTGSAFPQSGGRGTVNGTLAINDLNNPGASPVSLWIGLVPVDGGIDFQQQYLTYQFWVKTGAGGSFTIPNVLPGTYNLWAFGPGEVGTYKRTNVTVAGGQTLNLGAVTWAPLRLGPTVWDIGTPDRNSNEFNNGEHDVTPFSGVLPPYAGGDPHNTPTDWGAFLNYAGQYPNGVSFVVGTSNYANDWNYVQPTIPNGSGGFTATMSKIYFNLATAPSAAQTARLYIAFASAYSAACILTVNGTVQTASVMGSTDGNYAAIANPATGFFPPNHSFDSTVRLGSQGAWGDAYLDFAGTKLKAGLNEIDLGMRATGGAGNGNSFEYDYVRLELTGYSPSGAPTKTFTPSNTPTRTNTTMPTVSNTATRTAMASPTNTSANTATNTPTRTATSSPTRTATPSFTNTTANTATNSPTRTPSNSPTLTPSNTGTRTFTPTSTNTVGNTATKTPSTTPSNSSSPTASNTPTNTRTNTFTNTATPSPSNSRTNTPVNSPTRTPTATPTATNSSTNSATTTPSRTPTDTRTNTPVNTPTNSSTKTPSNTPTNSPANTSTPTETSTVTQTFTGTNPPTNTATNSPTNTGTNTPVNTPTNSLTRTPTSTPTTTATNTFTLSPTLTFTLTSANTATNTATRTPTRTPTSTPTTTATSTFTLSPFLTFTPSATLTPTAIPVTVQIGNGPSAPGNNTQFPGSLNVSVLQFQLSNPGISNVNLTSLTLTASGSGNDSSGITSVSLYVDVNGNGTVDGGDTLLQTAAYTGNNGTMLFNFTNAIPAGGSKTYLVADNFSGSANGIFQTGIAAITDLIGTNGTGPVNFTGAPLNGAVITIGAATLTPTHSPTNTPTSINTNTPTNTPTPTATKTNSSTFTNTPTFTSTSTTTPSKTPTQTFTFTTAATTPVLYPNPADGSVPVNLIVHLSSVSDVRVRLFTVHFRKVKEVLFSQVPAGSSTVSFTLTDNQGSLIGNGIYYVVVDSSAGHQVVKLMVLR